MSNPIGAYPKVVQVIMMAGHFRAYREWLEVSKLIVDRLPDEVIDSKIPTYIVTPDYNHPAGKRP